MEIKCQLAFYFHIWILHFEPQTKRRSVELHRPILPGKRCLRLPFHKESHGHCFLGRRRDFLVGIVRRGQTIDSDLYIRFLKTLEKLFRRVGHHRNIAELHHDSADHTRLKTQEAITKLGWTVLFQNLLPHISTSLEPSEMPWQCEKAWE